MDMPTRQNVAVLALLVLSLTGCGGKEPSRLPRRPLPQRRRRRLPRRSAPNPAPAAVPARDGW